MLFKKLSFNSRLFLILALQYGLMHLFSWGFPVSITVLEIIIFTVYTVVELTSFIYWGRRTKPGTVSGMIPLFFAVLWTVALFSQLQRESYPAQLTVINSLGMFTAFIFLLVEYIFLIKD